MSSASWWLLLDALHVFHVLLDDLNLLLEFLGLLLLEKLAGLLQPRGLLLPALLLAGAKYLGFDGGVVSGDGLEPLREDPAASSC